MMRIVKALPTTLKSPLGASDTSIVLQALHDSQGNDISMSSFGDEGVVVLKQGDVIEMIRFTNVTQNSDGSATLTVASSGRNVAPVYPYTSAATGEDFNAGASALISNDPYTLWKITEEYTNSVAYAGAPDASTTVKGLVEEATLAEVDADTAAGGTSARLFVNPSTLATSKYGTRLPTSDQKAALAGTPGTPSATNKFVTENVSLLAGETINGATLPVPVYQNKTDNEFYACDGNDTGKMKFVGFAVSNGTDGAALLVQFTGIVDGFTGLDEGEKYYLSDTAGTISTTPGTYEVLVGVAISTTQLLIQKGRRYANGNGSFTDAGGAGQVSTTAITCGFRPSLIRMSAFWNSSDPSQSHGSWTPSSVRSVYLATDESGATVYVGTSNVYIATLSTASGGDRWEISITSVTDTGFTISAEQKDASPGDCHYTFEVLGEL